MSEGNNQVIINEDGLFIPRAQFDRAEKIVSELKETGRLSLPKNKPPLVEVRRVEPIDLSRELHWLKEHRHEYTGQWVCVEGDQLIAHGPVAREVFAAARQAGISAPFVEYLSVDYDKPFGGW